MLQRITIIDFRDSDVNAFQYNEDEKLCIQSDMKIPPTYPEMKYPEPTIPIMSKFQGCFYGGTSYNVGEGRNPELGICGNCIGNNLFYETPIRVHEDCYAPFVEVEVDDMDGKTHKYCLYFNHETVDSCTAENRCEDLDSYLALLEGMPYSYFMYNIHQITCKLFFQVENNVYSLNYYINYH